MTTSEHVPVMLKAQGDRRTRGEARIDHLDLRARLRRALRSAGIAFGLALVFLPIPPLHWVVTPAALVASVVLLLRRLGQPTRLGGGGGPCPHCGQAIAIEPQSVAWPIDLNCPHCRWSVLIRPDDLPQT